MSAEVITVTVTQEHLDKAIDAVNQDFHSDPASVCVLAQAFIPIFDGEFDYAGDWGVYLHGDDSSVPHYHYDRDVRPITTNFDYERYDKVREMLPFTLNLTLTSYYA